MVPESKRCHYRFSCLSSATTPKPLSAVLSDHHLLATALTRAATLSALIARFSVRGWKAGTLRDAGQPRYDPDLGSHHCDYGRGDLYGDYAHRRLFTGMSWLFLHLSGSRFGSAVLAGLFPLLAVMFGVHQGFVPVYFALVDAQGFNSLFPILAMAGPRQVSAALAVLAGERGSSAGPRLKGRSFPGFLGIGERADLWRHPAAHEAVYHRLYWQGATAATFSSVDRRAAGPAGRRTEY